MIKENLERVMENIYKACQKVRRNPEEIKIVAVAKDVEIERVKEVIKCGIKDIGESRVQEARDKYKDFDGEIQLHMIGHLQTNKAKAAINLFSMLQSLDSVKLASCLNMHARKLNKYFDVLLQVKIEEGSKFGFLEEEVEKALESLSQCEYLRILGIMTIAPPLKEARKYFSKARKLFEKLPKTSNFSPQYLSMGMSNDYIVAVEEGANMLRIGRAIFGG